MGGRMMQRSIALAGANELRTARAEKRRALRSGALSAVEALSDEDFGSMRVFDLLLNLPRCGEEKARQIVNAVSVYSGSRVLPVKFVRELTANQREDLLIQVRLTVPSVSGRIGGTSCPRAVSAAGGAANTKGTC